MHVRALVCRAAAVQTTNAVDFVKLLLDMREKYESTITQAFADDKNFKNTLNSVRREGSWGGVGGDCAVFNCSAHH